MKLYSTSDKNRIVSFRNAVIEGIAPGGGLYLPAEIPALNMSFRGVSFNEIAYETASALIKDEIPSGDLYSIIYRAFNFEPVLTELEPGLSILELFHGPTLAFKDFGARFMAGCLSYFLESADKKVTVLAATSGDTGSAVAGGFYNKEGIDVVILYPSGKVSLMQEKQLTTYGGNITALEIEGNFDDCQRLVKEAFADPSLNAEIQLTSANSINIARLIPQSFYYIYAYSRLENGGKPPVYTVPSGNFGNLAAGLIAHKMGLPAAGFTAALNSNDVFEQYLRDGSFAARDSVATVSNAMDVGNPSNLARIRTLYDDDIESIRKAINAYSFSDKETVDAVKEVYEKYKYIIDPHGAVGYLAAVKDKKNRHGSSHIVLETAHPAKFPETIKEALGFEPETPARLQEFMRKEKQSVRMLPALQELKDFLLSHK